VKAKAISSLLLAGALAMALSGPAGAASKPASRQSPPLVEEQISTQGTNGFLVGINVHDRHKLTLTATKITHGLSIESATYEVPIRISPGSDEIKASFGSLGHIDMRFVVDSAKEFAPDPDCTGGKTVQEVGHWVGTLVFRGEEGFTRIRSDRAPGTVLTAPPLRCHQGKTPSLKQIERELEAIGEEAEGEEESGESSEAEEEAQTLELLVSARHGRVGLIAFREAAGKGHKRSSTTDLIVAGKRRRGRIEETGSILDIFAPGSYLRPAKSLEPTAEAVLKAPDPFSGSATFRTPPKGPTFWNGDLKVALPGFGTVRLTGKATRAVLCESLTKECTKGLRSPVAHTLLDRLRR
jgi:hypothetical protein